MSTTWRKVRMAAFGLAAYPLLYGIGCVSSQQIDDFARTEAARLVANFLAVPGQLALQDLNNQLTVDAAAENVVETAPDLD